MKVILAVLMTLTAICGNPLPQVSQEYPIQPYEFGYEVADAATNNYQNRVELKLPNGDVFGSWSILLPDGIVQTIIYNVTANQGFQYSITRVPTNNIAGSGITSSG